MFPLMSSLAGAPLPPATPSPRGRSSAAVYALLALAAALLTAAFVVPSGCSLRRDPVGPGEIDPDFAVAAAFQIGILSASRAEDLAVEKGDPRGCAFAAAAISSLHVAYDAWRAASAEVKHPDGKVQPPPVVVDVTHCLALGLPVPEVGPVEPAVEIAGTVQTVLAALGAVIDASCVDAPAGDARCLRLRVGAAVLQGATAVYAQVLLSISSDVSGGHLVIPLPELSYPIPAPATPAAEASIDSPESRETRPNICPTERSSVPGICGGARQRRLDGWATGSAELWQPAASHLHAGGGGGSGSPRRLAGPRA